LKGLARDQVSLLPPCIDDYIAPGALVRVVDAFVATLTLAELSFSRANPSLMVTRRCTVEHPFGTIKRMCGGGRFLTRGLER
jgi:hypothetical protein